MSHSYTLVHTAQHFTALRIPALLLRTLILPALLLLAPMVWGQTNPAAQALPFSLTSHSGNTLQAGLGMHLFGTLPTTRTTVVASGDMLNANGAQSGGWRSEDANGIAILASNSVNAGALVVAINTTGRTNIKVSWLCRTITQQASRDNSIALQYRVGTSGTWTDVGTSSTYTSQGKSAGDVSSLFTETLPIAAENQPVVQVRWIYWESNSPTGSRDRIAVDDISITGCTPYTRTFSYSGTPYCSNSGTANVTTVGTGTDGTYSSTAGLTLNASSGAITLGTSSAGSYTVTYTIPATATCLQYQTTASIQVDAPNTASISYTGSPFCSNGSDPTPAITGTTGGTFSNASGLVINETSGQIDLDASSSGTHTVTYHIPDNGACTGLTATTSVTINTATTWYRDADGDGFGNSGDTQAACSAPGGYIAVAGDCDDTNAAIKPGATEVCDGTDQDCDGAIDEGVLITFYQDNDGDGFGNAAVTQQACSAPGGYVAVAGDCDDDSNEKYPGNPETCDGLDNDCDSAVDEGVTNEYVLDADGDGYHAATTNTNACSAPAQHILLSASLGVDCDDACSSCHPGGTEVCDGADQDCDGAVDDISVTYYADVDGDGLGDPASPQVFNACAAPAPPSGYSANDDDTCPTAIEGLSHFSYTTCGADEGYYVGYTVMSGVPVITSVTICPAGSYCTGGTAPRQECSAGSFSDQEGQTQCTSCPSGTYSAVTGASSCLSCPSGEYQPLVGMTSCQSCSGTVNSSSTICSSLSYSPSTFCSGSMSTVMPSLSGTSGGTYSTTSLSLNVNSSTGEIDVASASVGSHEVCHSDGACTTITIVSPPDAGTGGSHTVCSSSSSVSLFSLLTGSPDAGGSWSFDGAPSSGSYDPASSTPGIYTYTVTNTGCSISSSLSMSTEAAQTWYADADGDTYGDAVTGQFTCDPSTPGNIWVTNGNDCDDTDASVHPGATETCDDDDEDCDGVVDNGTDFVHFRDADNDGYGTSSITFSSVCPSPPAGYVTYDQDCDDTDDERYPGAPEACDGVDQDCDGVADNGGTVYFRDFDGDGYGDASTTVSSVCATPPFGFVTNDDDCDDTDPAIHPGATEICGNGDDDDCDGTVDEESLWALDADNDLYYTGAAQLSSCTPGAGYKLVSTLAGGGDCDDSSASIHPGATEICDDVDQDCDGVADDGMATSEWALDADEDGYWVAGSEVMDCNEPSSAHRLVSSMIADGDCDDTDPAIHPGAAEVCGNGDDDDCDGTVDEESLWALDADNDLYYTGVAQLSSCTPGAGYKLVSTLAGGGDCDDSSASIHPGATEICDGVDQDCDSTIDEDLQEEFVLDADNDGYYTGSSVSACEAPSPDHYEINTRAGGGDCDDTDETVYPGATEICDGQLNNCNNSGLPANEDDDDGDGVLDCADACPANPQFSSSYPVQIVGGGSFCTIQAAINAATAGDEILVADGTYDETVIINKNGITLTGASTAAIIKAPYYTGADGNLRNTLLITGNGVTVENFTITRDFGSSAADWYACTVDQGVNFNSRPNTTLRNLHVHGNRNGILCNNSPDATIENCLIEDNRTGVQLANDVHGLEFTNNIVRDNFTHGLGINFDFGPMTLTNVNVESNSFTGNWYAQLNLQRNLGTPGTNIGDITGLDLSCNWYGSATITPFNASAGEPGYAGQLPSQFGGTDPGLNRTIAGTHSNYVNESYMPWLTDGTDAQPDMGFQPGGACNGVGPVHNQTLNTYHMTIQSGIDAATANNILVCQPGVYVEELVIDKPLDIRGANYNVSPNTGSRGPESIIRPSYSDPDLNSATANVMIYVPYMTTGLSINGFTIDGDNPAIGGPIDAIEALGAYSGMASTTIKNNIIKNISYTGLDLYNYYNGGASTTGNSIDDNRFENIQSTSYGVGVLIYNNCYTSITNNVMENVRIGIQTGNFSQADAGSSHSISGNSIESSRIGLFHNLHYSGATSFSITDNDFNTLAGATNNNGILVSSIQGTVGAIISNNTVHGARNGFNLWSNPTSNTITITGGSVEDCEVGVFANNYDGYSSNGNTSSYAVDGLVITNSSIADVHVKDNSSNTNGSTVAVDLTGTTSLNSSSTGVRLEGNGASVSFSGAVEMNGQSVYLEQISNSIDLPTAPIDATTVSFDGPTGGSATLSQNYAIENKILHKVDNAAIGLVRVKAGELFVTQSSGSIQLGIAAATAGDIVNVQDGTYAENIIANKAITLLGANAGNDCDSRVAESLIAPATGLPVSVTADNVTLNGFEITAPSYQFGVSLNHRSDLQIVFNNIHHINSTASAVTNTYAILDQLNAGAGTNVEISDNCISDVASSSLSGFSSGAIGILQSVSTGTLSGLSIERNKIDGVHVNNAVWPTGKIAYGIQINVGGGGAYLTTTGKVTGASIVDNEIGDLGGHIATGIALEGNTEDAVVTGNKISDLAATKVGTRAGGGYDLNGLKFENNRYVHTVTVENNSFATNTFTHSAGSGIGYAVANYVPAGVSYSGGTTGAADVSCNWFGTSNGAEITDNATMTGRIFNKAGASTTIVPYITDGTDTDLATIGFQPGITACSGYPVINTNTTEGFATIQAAHDDSDTQDGHTLQIATWTFNERVSLTKSLTLDGAGMTSTILDGTGLAGTGSGISIAAGNSGVTIKDLTVRNYALGGSSDAGIAALDANDDLVIQNCDIHNNQGGRGGIYVNAASNVDNVLIDNVKSHDHISGSRGIVIWNGLKTNITISNCEVYNNNCCGIELSDGTASGVSLIGNNIHDNADNGIGLVGLGGTAGANLVSGNTLTNNGRFGMELKLPGGTGQDSGAGSIVVENNTVSFASSPAMNNRDHAGIAVFRRGMLTGNTENNADIPAGVVIRNNTVSGFQQVHSGGEGYGIVVEGVDHTIANNTINNSDVAIQIQGGGHDVPNYVENSLGDGDQANGLSPNYFGRGNAPYTCNVIVTGNTLSGNTVDEQVVTAAGVLPIAAATNQKARAVDLEGTTYCTIQMGVDKAVNGQTLNVASASYDEQVLVNKAVTIDGATPKPVIDFTGTVSGKPTLFDVSVQNVTIRDMDMRADMVKLSSAVIATGASGVGGLQLIDNNVMPYGSTNAGSFGPYGNRNAFSVNYGGYRVNGTGGSITMTGNTIDGRLDTDPLSGGIARYFRAGLSTDECHGTFSGNTIRSINQDIQVRFCIGGAIDISNNTLNGGGIESAEHNAGTTSITIANNVFNGAFANVAVTPRTAMLRLKNNQSDIPTAVNGNTLNGHRLGLGLENYRNVSVSSNTFTPESGSTDYVHVAVNTKSISSNSNAIVQTEVNGSFTSNVFNSSGSSGGTALGFYDHDSDASNIGQFTIGGAGAENSFNAGIARFVHLDDQLGSSDAATQPTNYPDGGSWSTTMACWTGDMEISENLFDVGSGLQSPGSLTGGDVIAFETALYHEQDNSCLGQLVYLRLRVDVKALLDGPYASLGLMNDDLRDGSLIGVSYPLVPLGHPYAGTPWNHVGTESIDPSLLNEQPDPDDNIVDWVLLELRDATTPSTIVARRAALLQRDGDIVDLDGVSTVSFVGLSNANYYIAVRHRNHLGVMTATTRSLSPTPSTVDLTDPATATFGTQAQKLADGRMMLWAGNARVDERIKYTGISNDRDPILAAIGGIIPTNVLAGEYRVEDVNMNGAVSYAGSGNDRDRILLNIPGAITTWRSEQLP